MNISLIITAIITSLIGLGILFSAVIDWYNNRNGYVKMPYICAAITILLLISASYPNSNCDKEYQIKQLNIIRQKYPELEKQYYRHKLDNIDFTIRDYRFFEEEMRLIDIFNRKR